MSDPGVIRGTIDGQEKYCRIPIRSRLYESVMEDDTTELSAEAILAMPHDKAAAVIDAIMSDWLYWLKRAGELWVLTHNSAEEAEAALQADKSGDAISHRLGDGYHIGLFRPAAELRLPESDIRHLAR